MIYEGEQHNKIILQLSRATLGKSSKITSCLHRSVHNTCKILDVHFQELPDDYFGVSTRRHKADMHIRLFQNRHFRVAQIQDDNPRPCTLA